MQAKKAPERWQKVKSSAGRPRKLSHEAILLAAERLIRQHGTHALTLRSLSTELGVQAPTLYTYFSNLEEIEETALHRIFGSIPTPDLQRPEPLQDQLLAMFLALRELHIRSPGALTGRPGSAAWLCEVRMINQLLKTFAEVGMDDFRTIVAYRTLMGFTANDARAAGATDLKVETELLKELSEADAGYVQRLARNMPKALKLSPENNYRLIFGFLVERLLPEVARHGRDH